VIVNVFRRAAPHESYAAWLNELVGGGDELVLHDRPLVGLVRIVTIREWCGSPPHVARA
jgi:predicted nucleic acid-binding protein